MDTQQAVTRETVSNDQSTHNVAPQNPIRKSGRGHDSMLEFHTTLVKHAQTHSVKTSGKRGSNVPTNEQLSLSV